MYQVYHSVQKNTMYTKHNDTTQETEIHGIGKRTDSPGIRFALQVDSSKTHFKALQRKKMTKPIFSQLKQEIALEGK